MSISLKICIISCVSLFLIAACSSLSDDSSGTTHNLLAQTSKSPANSKEQSTSGCQDVSAGNQIPNPVKKETLSNDNKIVLSGIVSAGKIEGNSNEDPGKYLPPPPSERLKVWDFSPCWNTPVSTWHRSDHEWGTGPYARLTLDRENHVWVELFGWIRAEAMIYSLKASIEFSRTKDEPRIIHKEWSYLDTHCSDPDFPNPWGGRTRLNGRVEPVVFDSLRYAYLTIEVWHGPGGSC